MIKFTLALSFFLQAAPLDDYRNADFSQKKGKPDDGWKRRILLEGEVPQEMAIAQVGKSAPDFSALDSDGKPFNLADVLKKQVVVLTFQLADW